MQRRRTSTSAPLATFGDNARNFLAFHNGRRTSRPYGRRAWPILAGCFEPNARAVAVMQRPALIFEDLTAEKDR
jgi:hypothetical protein